MLALVGLVLSGCYSYQPHFAPEPPPAGQDVRIRFSETDPDIASAWQGRSPRVHRVNGRVLTWSPEVAVLAVVPPPTRGMSRESPHPDTVTILARRIITVERRDLHVGRTVAFAAGAAALGAITVRALINWARSAPEPRAPNDESF